MTLPPSKEIGYVTPQYSATPGWNYFGRDVASVRGDHLEEVAEMMWPMSIRIYHRMRTDSQIDALIRSVVMPLLRLKWSLKPNGARDEVVQDISSQLNLPINGSTEPFLQRGRKRFNHAEHLKKALLAPTVYGHMFFEIVGDVDPDTLRWKLSKLSERMPQTISRVDVERDGGLDQIVQYDYSNSWQGRPIPVSQLVAYPWEKEGGNWLGRSMLRPLFKHWIVKDLLMRIDTMKNERYGLGVPVGTAAPGGDPASMQKLASDIYASEYGGAGLPNGAKLALQGISGTLPDTLASIRYQDEAMARSFLAMFIQLGTTETGSRALGSEFVDFFIDALAGLADWYANITNQHVIEDIVDWNWGEDEQAPLLVWEEREEHPLSAQDLYEMARGGALLMDEDLQNWLRRRYSMPQYTGGQPLPTRPGVPMQEYVHDPSSPATVYQDPSSAPSPTAAPTTVSASALAGADAEECPECGSGQGEPCVLRNGAISATWSHPTRRVAADHTTQPRDSAGKWTVGQQDIRKAKLPAGREAPDIKFLGSRGCDGSHVHSASSQTLEDSKIGHRDPNPNEVKAAIDFRKMQTQWESATKDVVSAWSDVRSQQIDALVRDVESAVTAGDADRLASLVAPILGSDIITQHMISVATQAIAAAQKEAKDQGIAKDTNIDVSSLGIETRANAIATLMAHDLGAAASRNAVLRYGAGSDVSASDVAEGVRAQLESLTDAYLNDVLGGAMTQAQNSARFAVIDEYGSQSTQIYASELLDERTCENCAIEDGTEFTSMAAAEFDYPAGGYYGCSGGPRCRGTLVAVYGETD